MFVTLDALVRSSSDVPLAVYWGIFLLCLVGTYFYLWRVAKIRKQTQLLISTVAFAVRAKARGKRLAGSCGQDDNHLKAQLDNQYTAARLHKNKSE